MSTRNPFVTLRLRHAADVGRCMALCIALCLVATRAQAQGAPGGDDTAPPAASAASELPEHALPSQGRAGLSTVGRPLTTSSMADVRRAAALPPPMVLDANASAEDAPLIRSMIRDEAVHRDRVARIGRLRELATARGQHDRLLLLDRLEDGERQRHEARALMSRTQLSEPGFLATDSFLRQGGIMRLRHAQARNAGRGQDARLAGAQQRAGAGADARMLPPARASGISSGTRPSEASNGTSRGGRGGSGARGGSSSSGPR